ncbi:hypothetical protein A5742_17365 [Mycolicibacterium fortuitum]|uniref:Uncharacterized protein n=1 Tax=Mycolicibacterium fortuitum TaxID=1766 RepID=A0ABD6QTC8_MYCFO|nr:hypothetical protein A5742_17365 [Mycolicibacterium fortuitum]
MKWVLGGTALIAVIAITAVVAISLSGRDNDKGDGSGPTTSAGSGSSSEFASANDTGPVTIITEDPSCAAWTPVVNTLADQSKNGWLQRDPSIPATGWSPEQRSQHDEVGQSMRAAADQTAPLAKLTTHRVMRQLYEQFIAYARAYADAIPAYSPKDDLLARTASTATDALSNICSAITFNSAAARAPLVPEAPAPTSTAPVGDPAHPTRFLASPDPVCPAWQAALDQFRADTTDWRGIAPDVPAAQWSPEQKTVTEAVAPVMRESADTLEGIGRRSSNPTLQDFAVLAAQYRRAYAQALPTYAPGDQYLAAAALRVGGVVLGACKAAGD